MRGSNTVFIEVIPAKDPYGRDNFDGLDQLYIQFANGLLQNGQGVTSVGMVVPTNMRHHNDPSWARPSSNPTVFPGDAGFMHTARSMFSNPNKPLGLVGVSAPSVGVIGDRGQARICGLSDYWQLQVQQAQQELRQAQAAQNQQAINTAQAKLTTAQTSLRSFDPLGRVKEYLQQPGAVAVVQLPRGGAPDQGYMPDGGIAARGFSGETRQAYVAKARAELSAAAHQGAAHYRFNVATGTITHVRGGQPVAAAVQAQRAPAPAPSAPPAPRATASAPTFVPMRQVAPAMPAQSASAGQKVVIVQMTAPTGQAFNRATLNQENAQSFKQRYGFTDQQSIVFDKQNNAFIEISAQDIDRAKQLGLGVFINDRPLLERVTVSQLPPAPAPAMQVQRAPAMQAQAPALAAVPSAHMRSVVPVTVTVGSPHKIYITRDNATTENIAAFKAQYGFGDAQPLCFDRQGFAYVQIAHQNQQMAKDRGLLVCSKPAQDLQFPATAPQRFGPVAAGGYGGLSQQPSPAAAARAAGLRATGCDLRITLSFPTNRR
jgi:hypothetical protein